MIVNFDSVLNDEELLTNDKKIIQQLQIIQTLDFCAIENLCIKQPLETFSVSPEKEDKNFFLHNRAKAASGPSWYAAMLKLWNLSFGIETLEQDLETLCTELVGKKMRKRKSEVVGKDPVSGRVVSKYLDPEKIDTHIEHFKEFLYYSNNFPTSITMIVSHVYLLRMHMFEDGNSRTARAFMDFILKLREDTRWPVLCISIPTYSNIEYLNGISSQEPIVEIIRKYQYVILRYFDFALKNQKA